MAPSYPTTAAGLLAHLQRDPDAFPGYLAALEDLAKQLWPTTPRTRKQVESAKLRAMQSGAKSSLPPHKEKFPGADVAYRLCQELIDVVRDLPAVVAALQQIVHPGTVTPVAAPVFVGSWSSDELQAAGYPCDVWTDIGTGEVHHEEQRPCLPVLVESVSRAATELVALGAEVKLLRSRAAGYDELARTMRGGNRPSRRAARREARTAADNYASQLELALSGADAAAERFSAYVHTLTAALAALIDTKEDFTMPSLTTPAVVSDLATRIHNAITEGHGGRLVVSTSEAAFAWSPGQAQTLLTYLATGTVDGRHATVVIASDAATVVGPVAEGGTKPTVVQFTSKDVDLSKYAGIAEMSTEAANFTTNIEAATSSILVSQITRAIEADAVTNILADAGETVDAAADITAGVLAGIAAVRSNGGNPTVAGLNSDDWQAAMSVTGAAGGYVNFSSPEAGPGLWLGLHPVLLPTLTAGTALVLDGAAVSVLEPKGGPLCVVDNYSGLSTNKIRIAVETWATSQVTSPGGVAVVTVATTP